jgi:hypothetical protein
MSKGFKTSRMGVSGNLSLRQLASFLHKLAQKIQDHKGQYAINTNPYYQQEW